MRAHQVVAVGALVAGLSLAPAALGTTVATADRFACTFYAGSHGYSGKIVDIGCAYGERGDLTICEGTLQIAGAPQDVSREACRRAALR